MLENAFPVSDFDDLVKIYPFFSNRSSLFLSLLHLSLFLPLLTADFHAFLLFLLLSSWSTARSPNLCEQFHGLEGEVKLAKVNLALIALLQVCETFLIQS